MRRLLAALAPGGRRRPEAAELPASPRRIPARHSHPRDPRGRGAVHEALSNEDLWRLCDLEAFDERLFRSVGAAEVLAGCGQHFELQGRRGGLCAQCPRPRKQRRMAEAAARIPWRAAALIERRLGYRGALELDFFLSHSWKAGRWVKFWSLALVLNGPTAVALGLAVMIAAFPLSRSFPVTSRYSATELHLVDYGPWCSVLGVAACAVFLVSGQAIRETFRVRPFTFFFDGLCICQDDPEESQRGVRMLGCFVALSREMIVAMDETYWNRLWCIFEVALFARMSGPEHIHFASPELSYIIVAMCATQVLVSSLIATAARMVAIQIASSAGIFWFVCRIFQNLLFFPLACRHVRQTRQLRHRLKRFKLDGAACCSVQDDRKFIYQRIKACFGSVANFDRYVQQELYPIVEEHLSLRGRLPLCGILLVALPETCQILDVLAGHSFWEWSRFQMMNRLFRALFLVPCQMAFWTTSGLFLARLLAQVRSTSHCVVRWAIDCFIAILLACLYDLPFQLSPTFGSLVPPLAELEGHSVELLVNVALCLGVWGLWLLPLPVCLAGGQDSQGSEAGEVVELSASPSGEGP